MGKNKKKVQSEESPKSETKAIFSGDVKRSVVAIFFFALAILFVLGFLSQAKVVDAGILGKLLNSLTGLLFGVGKYISPIVLIAAGVILLFRKETLFYVSKLIGLSMAFVSVLGAIHILAYDGDKMLKVAKAGSGGGFLGYALAFAFLKLAGKIGGSIILIALVLIGVTVAFDFSLVKFFEKFFQGKAENEGDGEAQSEEVEEVETEEEVEKNPSLEVEEEKPLKKTKFVQDPNEESEKESGMAAVLKKAAAWKPKDEKEKNKKNQSKDRDQEEQLAWELPPISLLDASIEKAQGGDVEKNAKIIQDTLLNFGIEVELGEIKTGPTVTQYSFRPAVGVKLSRITTLSSDLALRLAARQVRIEAPIPGRSLVGIEVPNKKNATIRLPELLQALEFENRKSNLLLALGKDVSGNYIFGDLKKMPHLLIAGSTGSGKSVCVNTLILSMLYQNSPEDLKLILVDPKRVELTPYNGIPHLLTDVIVENGKVLHALKWAIGEMERRYKILQKIGSKDIASFNRKAESGEMFKNIDAETGEITEEAVEKIPYIVIIIDELADLMASHGKEVEGAIIRLAQMARAVGIHLILSTQKPIVTVITSLIKSNIPTRIAFRVPSLMDSRTILDASGAEKLLGNGDMLFSAAEAVDLRRVQGVFVSEEEVKRVVEFIRKQKFEKIEDSLEGEIDSVEEKPAGNQNGQVKTVQYVTGINFEAMESESDNQEDPLYEEAKKLVIQAGKASCSLLQRRLRIGYSRAARLVDMMEDNGVVGSQEGAKAREVLVDGEGSQPQYDDSMQDQIARDKWQM